MNRRSINRRMRERGAALIESAIVIGMLCVFLGCMVFVKDSYAGKITQQATTRNNAFGYAAHNCEGSAPTSTGSENGNASTLTTNDPGTSKVLSNAPSGETSSGIQDKTSSTLMLSHATATEKIQGRAHGYVQGSKGDMGDATLTRQIRSDSYVFCNEHPYDADPVSFASFFFKFFKSGLI